MTEPEIVREARELLKPHGAWGPSFREARLSSAVERLWAEVEAHRAAGDERSRVRGWDAHPMALQADRIRRENETQHGLVARAERGTT